MSEETLRQELCLKIRDIAGQLGELNDPDYISNSDAESYEFHVLTGLSYATVHTLDFDIDKLFEMIGYSIINFGLDIDPRINALMDALKNEFMSQLDSEMDDTET